eukprot:1195505-Prorocentrum_minimum.AAC.1
MGCHRFVTERGLWYGQVTKTPKRASAPNTDCVRQGVQYVKGGTGFRIRPTVAGYRLAHTKRLLPKGDIIADAEDASPPGSGEAVGYPRSNSRVEEGIQGWRRELEGGGGKSRVKEGTQRLRRELE